MQQQQQGEGLEGVTDPVHCRPLAAGIGLAPNTNSALGPGAFRPCVVGAMSDTRVGMGVLAACACGGVALGFWWAYSRSGSSCAASSQVHGESPVADGLVGLVGNTPLMELTSISTATGCRVLAKAEHLSPGGSVKDRVAIAMVLAAEAEGKLVPGQPGTVVEGTGGNTGIGLAMMAAARGYKCIIATPEDISVEKIDLMRALGAEVHLCPPVPFKDERHYVHESERVAAETGGVLMREFDNVANYKCHEETTGPEIWQQTDGKVDAFVCAVGTGGTIAGVSTFLRGKDPTIPIYCIDSTGSGIKSYLDNGLFAPCGRSHIEEVGLMRKTANFAQAKIDGAFRATDREAVEMGHYLIRNEGVFVGTSAALNVCGAVKLARKLGPGHTIVTVLYDGGDRYRSKMYNSTWLEENALTPQSDGDSLEFVL